MIKLVISASLAVLIIYIVSRFVNKIKHPELAKIKPAITMQGTVILWHGIIILRSLTMTHFHLFAAAMMNIIHILFVLGGLIWLLRRPSREPIILLIVFQVAGVVMNYIALCNLTFEHGLSVVIVAFVLQIIAIYYLIKAIREIKAA